MDYLLAIVTTDAPATATSAAESNADDWTHFALHHTDTYNTRHIYKFRNSSPK